MFAYSRAPTRAMPDRRIWSRYSSSKWPIHRLRFDRQDKAATYAEAGIADYWIVNLVDDVLEIHRDTKGGTYHERIVLKPADTVSPLAFPDLEIAVSDLLPEMRRRLKR